MLEYNNIDGFRCQRCREWTFGGNLYPGMDHKRICFLCYLDDQHRYLKERYSSVLDLQMKGTTETSMPER